jgi:hypothetical protein
MKRGVTVTLTVNLKETKIIAMNEAKHADHKKVNSHEGHKVGFPGDAYALWTLSSAVFFYGGRPFLKGFFDSLAER